MPLFKKIIKKKFTLAVWKLTEPEVFFYPNKKKFLVNPKKLEKIHLEQQRKEWLCSRYLGWNIAKEMDGSCGGIWSDFHNKPHIKKSNLQISISHAKPYVAVLVHKNSSCGIDIGEKKEKLIRLAPKFLTKYELSQTKKNIDALALAWGAKEAIYKLYGKKRLRFKEHIFLSKLDTIQQKGDIYGRLKVKDSIAVQLKYEQFENHILVYTI